MECGVGTLRLGNSTCVPDCSDLRRRSVSCEPFCSTTGIEDVDNGGGGGNNAQMLIVIVVVVVVVVVGFIALCTLIIVPRQRARRAMFKVTTEITEIEKRRQRRGGC